MSNPEKPKSGNELVQHFFENLPMLEGNDGDPEVLKVISRLFAEGTLTNKVLANELEEMRSKTEDKK